MHRKRSHLTLITSATFLDSVGLQASGVIRGSSQACAAKYNRTACGQSQEVFEEALTQCQDSITPLIEACIQSGLDSGYEIPEELKRKYQGVLGKLLALKAPNSSAIQNISTPADQRKVDQLRQQCKQAIRNLRMLKRSAHHADTKHLASLNQVLDQIRDAS